MVSLPLLFSVSGRAFVALVGYLYRQIAEKMSGLCELGSSGSPFSLEGRVFSYLLFLARAREISDGSKRIVAALEPRRCREKKVVLQLRKLALGATGPARRPLDSEYIWSIR